MSNLLVRKSLELLDYEDLFKGQKKKRRNIRYKETLDLISTKHRIISKYDTDFDTILDRSSKTTVYETQKCLLAEQDPIDKNIEQLLSFSRDHINSDTSNLLHSAIRKKYVQQEKPKKSETVFTEKDFKKFEQKYVE